MTSLQLQAQARLKLLAAQGAAAPVPEVGGFRGYVFRHNPGLLQYEHIPRLLSVGERIVTGELKRVIVTLPPRYFKSEVFSRLLAGYFLRRHPKLLVGLSSYGAELAWELSEEARHHYQADGGEIRRETSAKKRWRTRDGGTMWAQGAGGPILGRGWHLGLVDDPMDPDRAHSPAYQRRFERWWSEKWLSRQEPNARLVFVMQRLGTSDPVDFLFRREVGEDTDLAPEHWHVVVCDEIKSDAPLGRWGGPMGLPPTCTVEPDERKSGQVLAPSRFDPAAVERLQRSAGALTAQSQRQQRPAAPEGDFWRAEWFGWKDGHLVDTSHVYDELPEHAFAGGKDWDTAYTKDDHNAATAYVESYRGPGAPDAFPIYIHDVDWEWLEFPELVAWVRSLAGPHYVEQKASGKSAAQTLRRDGVMVSEVKVEGDKLARAASAQPIVSTGRVYVRRSVLRKLLLGERQGILRVTAEGLVSGTGDLDLNDALVQAIHRHTGRRVSQVKRIPSTAQWTG